MKKNENRRSLASSASEFARVAAERGALGTTRRRFVMEALGGLTGYAILPACRATSPGGTSGAGGVGGSGGSTCTLYPRQTEGPYYLNLNLLRSDITEGKPGAPLALDIQIVRAGSCVPIANAAVDIWHCDAAGIYSGYAGQLGGQNTTGQTFLRGTQVTDANGRATFNTIYPGWYPGRTTHVHFKAHLTATSVVTSQMYFDESLTAAVYRTPPYSAHGQKDTSNAGDFTAQSGGGLPALLAVTDSGSGYTAALTISVA